MQHIDEHILGLYVLGAESISERREPIERHLSVCEGCKQKVDELFHIYRDVDHDLADEESLNQISSAALVWSVTKPAIPYADRAPVASPGAAGTIARRLSWVVRRYPVVAGGFLMVFGAVAFFSMQAFWNTLTHHGVEQPAAVQMNQVGTALEVLSGGGHVVYNIPVTGGQAMAAEELETRVEKTQLGDINGDGSEEVITGSYFKSGGIERRNVLRAFDSAGNELFERSLGSPVTFRGAEYLAYYTIFSIRLAKSLESTTDEIWSVVRHYRSPCFVVRLGYKGEVLGEYWHYGQVYGPVAVSLEGEDHELIAFCGTNDVRDAADSAFPVIGILDPGKLEGRSQFSESDGFGFPRSMAEKYYLRVEIPGMSIPRDSSRGKGGFTYMRVSEDSSIFVQYESPSLSKFPKIDYTFDKTLRLRIVSIDDDSRQILQEQTLKSKSPQKLATFIDRLKAGVRYWDGNGWRTEITRVHAQP